MMKRLLLRTAAAALALAGACGAASAASPAAVQAQRDWTATVVATPEGGFRMGNPAAAVKVVEYVSLTCGHCRQFAEASGAGRLRAHVASGRVSFEIRPFPLDEIAAVGSQINRCAAPARAFALNDAILRSQEEWFARLHAVSQADAAAIQSLDPAAFRQRVAALAGFDSMAAAHGIGPAALAACLADEAGAARVAAVKAAAEAMGVAGTPTFLLNGAVAEHVHDWAALEPLLGAGR
jgi:protein-disulfide isomerase